MLVENNSYVVKDAEGNKLAEVDGSSTDVPDKEVDRAFVQRSGDIFSDKKSPRKTKQVIYAVTTSGNNSVESRKGGLKFKAMDDAGIMTVSTDTAKAQFSVSGGSLKLPGIKEGESFDFKMEGADKNSKDVRLTGTGTGSEAGAEISLEGGKVNLQNVEIETISIGGKDNEDGKDINGMEAYLENYVVKFRDGEPVKPAVHVKKKDGTELKEGSDFAVSYRDNTASGNAAALVYGIGDYSGRRELKFTIADEAKSGLPSENTAKSTLPPPMSIETAHRATSGVSA